jgi:hypothetical protein
MIEMVKLLKDTVGIHTHDKHKNHSEFWAWVEEWKKNFYPELFL